MIGKAGATLLCDALKSNTTITKLNLGRPKQKKQHTMTCINNPFFKTTVNNVEDAGATSLNELLKTNTTLTKLNLSSEDKRNNTSFIHQTTLVSHGDKQETGLGKQEQHH